MGIRNASSSNLQVLGKIEFLVASAIHLDNDFFGMKLDARNLHRIPGTRGNTLKPQSRLQSLVIDRLPYRHLVAFLPGGQRLHHLGKFS